MRPLRLLVSAFGPYVDEQELDFGVLRGNPLFLLSGPTGSGKTMLLDAMCFALFGECSGEARKAQGVRSHHASPHQPTRVIFDFAVGTEMYRVERSPEQDRPKRRGTGMVRMAPQATLCRRTAAPDDEGGEPLATQPLRVNERVEEILGFTSAQFRQVIVLPQGEFKRFLEAKSNEREDILEVLFQTGEYRRIEEALAARAKAAENDWRVKRADRDALLRQSGAESREGLEAAIAQLSDAKDSKTTELAAVRTAAESARASLDAAREDARRLNELHGAEKAYDTLAASRDVNNRRKLEVAIARKAAGVAPFESDAAARSREAAAAVCEAEKAEADAVRAAKEDEKTRGALAREEERKPEREQARSEVQHLESLREKVGALDRARTALDRARNSDATARDAAARADAAAKACTAETERKRTGLTAAQKKAEAAPRLAADVARLDAALTTRKLLDADERKLADAARKLERAERKRIGLDAALESARAAQRETERRWIEGQAARLAARLVEGEACPVCGSTSHPAPAHVAASVPSDAEWERAGIEVENARRQRDAAGAAEHEARVAAATLEEAVRQDRERLGEFAATSAADLTARFAETKRLLDIANAAASEADRLASELEELTARTDSLRIERDRAAAKAGEAAASLAACDAVFRAVEADVPEPLRSPGALETAIASAKAKAAVLDSAIKDARAKAVSTGEKAASTRAAALSARAAADQAARIAASALAAFDNERAAAGFESLDAFRAAVRTPQQIESIERLTAKFESDLAAAEDRLRRAREQASGLKEPDLPSLERVLNEANSRLEACIAALADIDRRLCDARKQLQNYDAMAAECERLERRHRTVARIAEVANGRNTVNINFQRFVQATLLDRVLQAATERLRVMSNGRYELQRAAETLDRRTSAGLDLEVFDAHTGTARPVSTLSGGESFQASLALALGLAGVVQSHSGGLHLESIFIDEGFGSLDADALALAMDTLRDLQQGGRLIGIVSHVAELKEQIGARLEVSSGRRGSVARFVVN